MSWFQILYHLVVNRKPKFCLSEMPKSVMKCEMRYFDSTRPQEPLQFVIDRKIDRDLVINLEMQKDVHIEISDSQSLTFQDLSRLRVLGSRLHWTNLHRLFPFYDLTSQEKLLLTMLAGSNITTASLYTSLPLSVNNGVMYWKLDETPNQATITLAAWRTLRQIMQSP